MQSQGHVVRVGVVVLCSTQRTCTLYTYVHNVYMLYMLHAFQAHCHLWQEDPAGPMCTCRSRKFKSTWIYWIKKMSMTTTSVVFARTSFSRQPLEEEKIECWNKRKPISRKKQVTKLWCRQLRRICLLPILSLRWISDYVCQYLFSLLDQKYAETVLRIFI